MSDQKRKFNKVSQRKWWQRKKEQGFMRVQFVVTEDERDYLRAELNLYRLYKRREGEE